MSHLKFITFPCTEDGKDLKAMDVEDMENMQKLMETTPGPKPSKAKVPIA